MATNFLLTAGTTGFIATPFNLQSSQLNSLGNGNTAISSVGGTSGVFNQTNIANAMMGEIWFQAGGAFTPTAGGSLWGWFIPSDDGGAHFEKLVANTAPPRSPDFIIPLFTSAYAAGDRQWCQGRYVMLEWASFEVLIQNNAGVTLPASGNLVYLGPVATQY
jgi:hypothetical protein